MVGNILCLPLYITGFFVSGKIRHFHHGFKLHQMTQCVLKHYLTSSISAPLLTFHPSSALSELDSVNANANPTFITAVS